METLKVLKTKMKFDIGFGDINRIERIGMWKGKGRRPIRVEFLSEVVALLARKAAYDLKGTGYWLEKK